MLRESLEDLHMNGKVGDWCFCDTNQGLLIFLRYPIEEDDAMLGDFWPYSEAKEKGDIVNLPLSGDSSEQPIWQWDGNREAPTLSPSILVKVGDKERWHGFLRVGKLITV